MNSTPCRSQHRVPSEEEREHCFETGLCLALTYIIHKPVHAQWIETSTDKTSDYVRARGLWRVVSGVVHCRCVLLSVAQEEACSVAEAAGETPVLCAAGGEFKSFGTEKERAELEKAQAMYPE
jgi:hypothetical protein